MEVLPCRYPSPGVSLMQSLSPPPSLTPAPDGSLAVAELSRGYLRLKAWGRAAASRTAQLQGHLRDLETTKARCRAGA